jgi:anti-anti-sigma factor
MSQFQHFDIHCHDDFTEVRLADTTYFDVIRYAEIQDELMQFVDERRPGRLVINFNRIQYCSTALINGVLRVQKRLVELGGTIKLCGMSESVRESFDMLGLDGTVFHVYASEADALAAF